MTSTRAGAVWRSDETHRVTTLELFFDLVFVFAFTQVTQLMADDPTATGALHGFVLFALLWWAWCSFAWLGNQAHADEGVVRATIIVAMAAMFVVALAIPESFADLPGGLPAPLVFAGCYAVVRLAHLGCYLVAAGADRALRRQVLATVAPVTLAVALLVAGGLGGPPAQPALWAVALLVDYLGIWLAGTDGWRVHSPGHFAERFGLIVLVALGESLVAVGVGVAEQPVSAVVIVGAVLGICIAVCLWWLYFDVVAHVAQEVLTKAQGAARSRLARDAFTYLHFPIVGSILFIALGLKKVLAAVSDETHHGLADPLTGLPLIALFGGIALYLLGHVAFRRRNVGTWNPHRTIAAAVLVLLVPVAWWMPAIASLALAAGVLLALVGYEVWRFGAPRAAVRRQAAGGTHAAQ